MRRSTVLSRLLLHRHKTTSNSSNSSNNSNNKNSSNSSNSSNRWLLRSTNLQIMSPLCRHKWFKVRMEVWLSKSSKPSFRSSGDKRARTPSQPMNLFYSGKNYDPSLTSPYQIWLYCVVSPGACTIKLFTAVIYGFS
jgi:hypothetical protein